MYTRIQGYQGKGRGYIQKCIHFISWCIIMSNLLLKIEGALWWCHICMDLKHIVRVYIYVCMFWMEDKSLVHRNQRRNKYYTNWYIWKIEFILKKHVWLRFSFSFRILVIWFPMYKSMLLHYCTYFAHDWGLSHLA